MKLLTVYSIGKNTHLKRRVRVRYGTANVDKQVFLVRIFRTLVFHKGRVLEQSQSGRGYGSGEPGRAWRGLGKHRGRGLAVGQGLGMGGLGQPMGKVVSERLDVLMMRGGGMGDGVV